MSIFYLDPQDFHVRGAKTGNVLSTELKGISIVFFYHINHAPSVAFIEEYRKLPRLAPQIVFALADLTSSSYAEMTSYIRTQKRNIENKENPYNEIIDKSYDTLMPIKSVPLIICYVDGIPYMVFKGKLSLEKLIEFVKFCYAELDRNKKAQALMSQGDFDQRRGDTDSTVYHQCDTSSANGIAQCFGMPYTPDEDVMYLEFNRAYKA